MDVKKIDKLALSRIAGKKGQPGQGERIDFQTILPKAQTQREPRESSQLSRVSALKNEPLPGSISPAGAEISSMQSRGSQAAQNALDLLEGYQKTMADPGKTLKEISPLLESLSRQAGDLDQIAAGLTPSDPLWKILNELQILSSLEVEKFNRGDYI